MPEGIWSKPQRPVQLSKYGSMSPAIRIGPEAVSTRTDWKPTVWLGIAKTRTPGTIWASPDSGTVLWMTRAHGGPAESGVYRPRWAGTGFIASMISLA